MKPSYDSDNGPSSTVNSVPDTDPVTESQFDDERLLSVETDEVFTNPAVGQQYRVLDKIRDSRGEHLVMEIRYQPDAQTYPEHVHPLADETYKVLSGELVVTLDGEERLLTPGEELTLPAGIPHTHGNASRSETRVLYQIGPITHEEKVLRTLLALAEAGKTDGAGKPSLLQLAVTMDTYPDVTYLSSPPVRVQKMFFKGLAPLGRLLGYTADYPPGEFKGSSEL